MLTVFRERPPIVLEAQKAQFKPHFIIQVFIFIGIFLASQVAMSIPMLIFGAVYGFRAGLSSAVSDAVGPNDREAMNNVILEAMSDMLLPYLFLTIFLIIFAIIYCRSVEKRSLYSMGFNRKKAFSDYITGLLIGFLMFSAAVLIAFLCGTLTFDGFVLEDGIYLLLAFFAGFMIQGMGEEVLTRGYFMISLANRSSLLLAVLTISVLFALLHSFNNAVDTLPLVNIALFGIFASIYTLKMNSIWGISAVHTAWNFVQGNVFGISVSGNPVKVSLLSFRPKEVGTIINGGAFGLEGGLAVTTVLVISIIILLSLDGRELKAEVPESAHLLNRA